MILNTYAILLAFAATLRLILGVLIIPVAMSARPSGMTRDPDGTDDGLHLAYLLAVVLAGLGVISWPLLYLLLQSYVQEWPGVMCVYGVTRIGSGSTGLARHLPDVLGLLHFSKPAVVF